jgi:hypothetical protein
MESVGNGRKQKFSIMESISNYYPLSLIGEVCGWAGSDGGGAVVFAQEDRDRASKSYIQKLLNPTYTNFR